MRPSVQDTPDLRRVVDLPRRVLDERTMVENARILTKMLHLAPSEALRPPQGQILADAIEQRGVYAGGAVGLGKTLLGWLAPVVLEPKRVVLLLPGGLRPDVLAMHREYYTRWRRFAGGITIISIDEMARIENEDRLFREAPDLIVIDEVDTVRNTRAACARRIARYVGEYEPMVCSWTGTPGRLSIGDFAHVLVWCLKNGAPVPLRESEAKFWGLALDEVSGFRQKARPLAGALERLGGGNSLEGVRAAFHKRLVETPGVVILDGDTCDQPITVSQVVAPPDPVLEKHFKTFRTYHETPDGWPTTDALSVYRHAGELGSGLYLRWNPRPPLWWYGPRKTFASFVREKIDEGHGDTELAIARAFSEDPEVADWLAVKPKFTPNSEPVWLSDSVLRSVAARLAAHKGPAIVWTWNVAFGIALQTMTKLRYYGAGGYDMHGGHISALPCYGANGSGPVPSIILSGQANLRGRNLQAWQHNVIVTPPRSARYLEQMFGRTHRAGQRHAVTFEVVMTSGDTFDGMHSSLREAAFGKAVFGMTQKLLRAKIVPARIPTEDSPYRWAHKHSHLLGENAYGD